MAVPVLILLVRFPRMKTEASFDLSQRNPFPFLRALIQESHQLFVAPLALDLSCKIVDSPDQKVRSVFSLNHYVFFPCLVEEGLDCS
jgi:hypothetical protein